MIGKNSIPSTKLKTRNQNLFVKLIVGVRREITWVEILLKTGEFLRFVSGVK